MTFEFDRDTAPLANRDGQCQIDLQPGWMVAGAVNGGYLLATVGRCLQDELARVAANAPGSAGKADPLVLSAHYLAASEPGPASVDVAVQRDGRATSSATARLQQNGQLKVQAMATFTNLAALPEEVETTARPPAMPPIEECLPASAAPEDFRKAAPLLERFDLRFDPITVGWAMGRPSGAGAVRAWFDFKDGRVVDPIALLLAVDALPPVSLDLGRPGWAPTIALTAHVRAHPAPGPLLLSQFTRNVAHGMFEEDCEVWDSSGRLVAQSRQLAMLPRRAD